MVCAKSTELKRWIDTESRWKRNERSLSSPEWKLSLRPRSLRNSTADKLNVPRFSTAIGWKVWLGKRLAYCSNFLSATISAI